MVVLRPHTLEGRVLLPIPDAPDICFRVSLPKELPHFTPDDGDAAEATVVALFRVQLPLQRKAWHPCGLHPMHRRLSLIGAADRKLAALTP